MTPAAASPAGPTLPPPAPVAVRRSRAEDIEQHTGQLHGWDLRYDQLDRGRFEGGFTDIRWPGVQLFVERTSRRLRQRGQLMPDSCGFGLLLGGDGSACVDGLQAGTGTLMMCDAAELDVCTPADCTLAGMVVDAGVLRQAADRMSGVVLPLKPGSLRSITPPAERLAPWRDLLLATVRAVADRPALLDDEALRQRLHDDLLAGLIDAVAASRHDEGAERAGQRKRVVERACELMMSRPDEPPSLLDICSRVGASPRKLGYCFRDVLGLSPALYLKTVRLNAARRELSRADGAVPVVYDVAARWGFWHFGHFSTDYKRHFGELPSETVRRARPGRD